MTPEAIEHYVALALRLEQKAQSTSLDFSREDTSHEAAQCRQELFDLLEAADFIRATVRGNDRTAC